MFLAEIKNVGKPDVERMLTILTGEEGDVLFNKNRNVPV
jgi:hypothetical protein